MILDTAGRLHIDEQLMDELARIRKSVKPHRILGMGDVLTLIERAEQGLDEQKAAEMEKRLRKSRFTFEDFLDELDQVRHMGSLQSILGMIPGMSSGQLKGMDVDDQDFDRIRAMILSMTPEERQHPEMIDGSRRVRIAAGAGTNKQAVNQLLKQFKQMQKMMKQLGSGRAPSNPFQMLGM